MHCPTTSHEFAMRKISIKSWPEFAAFLTDEQGIEGKKVAMGVYRRRFIKLVGWLNGRDFTRENFRLFVAELKELGRKNSYINNFVKTARHIDKFQGTDFMRGYRELHEQPSGPKEILTPEEIKELAAVNINYSRDRAFINRRQELLIWLFATTGCRNEEAINLRISELFNSHVVFRDTKNGDNRFVPITQDFYDRLSNLERRSEYVFSGSRGTKLSQQEVNRDLKRRATACGIKKRVYAHLFRHTFCTEMVDQGVNVLELAKITGHHDLASLMIYYHQSLTQAKRIIMMHPLLRPSLTFEQQGDLVKKAVSSIINRNCVDLTTIDGESQLTIMIKRKPYNN